MKKKLLHKIFIIAGTLIFSVLVISCSDSETLSSEAFFTGSYYINIIRPTPCMVYDYDTVGLNPDFKWDAESYKSTIAAVFQQLPIPEEGRTGTGYDYYYPAVEDQTDDNSYAHPYDFSYGIGNPEDIIWMWTGNLEGNPSEGVYYQEGTGVDENGEPVVNKTPPTLAKNRWYYLLIWSFNSHLKIVSSSRIQAFCISPGGFNDCGEIDLDICAADEDASTGSGITGEEPGNQPEEPAVDDAVEDGE